MGGYQAYTGNPWPNYTQWVDNTWGSGYEGGVIGCWLGSAMNLVFSVNPVYALDDFLAFFPKFFGAPTPVANGAFALGTSAIALPLTAGLAIGQFLQVAGFPKGTVITGVTLSGITVNTVSTSAATSATLFVYEAPPIPIGVIQAFINLATASLAQARWQDQWAMGIAWYIAHHCTLFAETDVAELQTAIETIVHGEAPAGAVPGTIYQLSAAPPGGALQSLTKNGLFMTPGVDYALVQNQVTLTVPTVAGDVLYAAWPLSQQVLTPGVPTGAAIAAQGVATGIMTSKSVGDVSASYQALASLESWGSWNLTKYGQQFATMALVIGAGPMVIR